MTAVYLCECKHAKGVHQGMTYWCREPGCSCKRYTPDFAAAETAAIVARAQAQPDQPALSAQLARVEQERDEARACWSAAERDLTTVRAERDAVRADLDRLTKAYAERLADRQGEAT